MYHLLPSFGHLLSSRHKFLRMGPVCNEYAPWTSHGIHLSILITIHLIMACKYYLSLILRCTCSKFARKSRLFITNKRMLKSALYQFINVTRRFNRRTDNACDPIKMMNWSAQNPSNMSKYPGYSARWNYWNSTLCKSWAGNTVCSCAALWARSFRTRRAFQCRWNETRKPGYKWKWLPLGFPTLTAAIKTRELEGLGTYRGAPVTAPVWRRLAGATRHVQQNRTEIKSKIFLSGGISDNDKNQKFSSDSFLLLPHTA